MRKGSLFKFLLCCIFNVIITCSLIFAASLVYQSKINNNNNKATETSAKVADVSLIKAQLQSEIQNSLKDNISIFSLNDCFKKTYYISHNGVKMYNKIGDEKSVIRCLDTNDEVIAYSEENGYIYCENNTSQKGWIKKDANDLKPMDFYSVKYLIDVNLSKQVIDIYNNGNIIKSGIKCSTGTLGNQNTETPAGIFKIKNKLVYPYGLKLNNSDGSQETVMYPIQFFSNYLIHSVPVNMDLKNVKNQVTEIKEEKDKLGSPASHGCIRLSVEDAKWVYNNISTDSEVYVHY